MADEYIAEARERIRKQELIVYRRAASGTAAGDAEVVLRNLRATFRTVLSYREDVARRLAQLRK